MASFFASQGGGYLGTTSRMGSVVRYIFRAVLPALLFLLVGLIAMIWVHFSIDGGIQALNNFDLMTSRGQIILAFVAITGLIAWLLVPVIARHTLATQTAWARFKPLFMFACLAGLGVVMVFHDVSRERRLQRARPYRDAVAGRAGLRAPHD